MSDKFLAYGLKRLKKLQKLRVADHSYGGDLREHISDNYDGQAVDCAVLLIKYCKLNGIEPPKELRATA
jgi:hypothetical protein